jgi:hypothetical protein
MGRGRIRQLRHSGSTNQKGVESAEDSSLFEVDHLDSSFVFDSADATLLSTCAVRLFKNKISFLFLLVMYRES